MRKTNPYIFQIGQKQRRFKKSDKLDLFIDILTKIRQEKSIGKDSQ